MLNKKIKKLLKEAISKTNIWYHGTPDVRELEKMGGFSDKKITSDYISDIDKFNHLQKVLKKSRESGNDEMYFKTLDLIPKLKSKFEMRSPIFLTNDASVARTYADAKRAFDYQNALEKVLKVQVSDGNGVKIVAIGERFRFINVNNVKRGFTNAGVSESEFNKVINQFNYSQRDKTKIRTNDIAVLGEWFGFDYIDVIGVLDSYEGGKTKSTVRMVFDPSTIKILN